MTQETLQIISNTLLPDYLQQVFEGMKDAFDNLQDAEISTDDFNFYISVASVFSSKIEGELIELDSYVKHKKFGIDFQPDYIRKIDDLYNAYIFAQTHPLNEPNVIAAHQLLSRHILADYWQGRYRTGNMYVITQDGKIEYIAASPYEIGQEMDKFFHDVRLLLSQQDMGIEEVFFYAAMIHLLFVKIHPWNDGNGRIARLLEKWFLAQKLGSQAWFIQSERYYYQSHATYYKNIRLLGLEYATLDYSQALPFLLMLPEGMKWEKQTN